MGFLTSVRGTRISAAAHLSAHRTCVREGPDCSSTTADAERRFKVLGIPVVGGVIGV